MANITGTASDETLTGTAGDDDLNGAGGSDILFGGAGNDSLRETTAEGNDQLYGGDGDDYLFLSRVSGGTTLLDGGSGNDTFLVQQYSGAVTVLAGDGNDNITLWTPATITSGAGVDSIILSPSYRGGVTTVTDFQAGIGGDGLDIAGYVGATTGWDGGSNPFATGYARVVQSGADVLVQVGSGSGSYQTVVVLNNVVATNLNTENFGGLPPDGSAVPGVTLTGGYGNDSLVGGPGADHLDGSSGSDSLIGGAGSDQLNGDDGDDTLDGSAGSDVLQGGAGSDRLVETTDGGSDQLFGGDGNDSFFLSRQRGGPTLLDGGDGSDIFTVQQYSGSVTVDGGAGEDTITLWTPAVIVGGEGSDTITLSGHYRGGVTTVTDFEGGSLGDRLNLSEYLRAYTSWNGSQNPFQSGHLRLLQSGSDTLVQIDQNGAGRNFVTTMRLTGVTGASVLSANLGFDPGSPIVTAHVNAPTSLVEGQASNLSITFFNVSSISTDMTVTIVGTSTATGGDVQVPAGNFSFSGSYLPARDYTYSFGPITAFDDRLVEGLENLRVVVTASGQSFGASGDSIIINVDINDNDFRGDYLSNTLTGDVGINFLDGGAGADVLLGNGGDDVLVGGPGSDVIDGGSGSDTLFLDGRAALYSIGRSGGDYLITLGNSTDTIRNVERVSFDRGATSVSMAEFQSQTFNAYGYLLANPDLLGWLGYDAPRARDHYFTYGVNEGRALGTFNAESYLASNVDLARWLGDNPLEAARHYVEHGQYEGRPLSTFNALSYLASNPDLAAWLGTGVVRATTHWIQNGNLEGRSTSSFDGLRYVASNPDLILGYGVDGAAATIHWLQTGLAAGRSATAFNPMSYLASNVDLARWLGVDTAAATAHYLQNGFFEGRSTASFDARLYAASSNDLAAYLGTDAQLAAEHYIEHGLREGRPTTGFDAAAYLLSNQDLAGRTASQALDHWLAVGADQGRAGDSLFGREQTSHTLTGGAATGAIDTIGDRDWYALDLALGETVTIDVSAAGSGDGSLVDSSVAIYDALGNVIGSDNDSGPGLDGRLTFTATAGGSYYVVVTSSDGSVGTYTVSVSTAYSTAALPDEKGSASASVDWDNDTFIFAGQVPLGFSDGMHQPYDDVWNDFSEMRPVDESGSSLRGIALESVHSPMANFEHEFWVASEVSGLWAH